MNHYGIFIYSANLPRVHVLLVLLAADNNLQTVRNARRRLEKECISESDVLNNISLTPAWIYGARKSAR